MRRWRHVGLLLIAALAAATTFAQSDPRSLQHLLKSAPPKHDDARLVNANIPELVKLRLSQLEEDLNLLPAQLPAWNGYRGSVERMLDDIRRGARVSASETTAPRRLDALADTARNRLAAVEEIVDAGKVLYEVLTPQQKAVADRRLALPLATLTGQDAGADLGMRSAPRQGAGEPPPPK